MKCKHCGTQIEKDWVCCKEPDESATEGVIDFEDRKPILFMGQEWTSYKISYDKSKSAWKIEN